MHLHAALLEALDDIHMHTSSSGSSSSYGATKTSSINKCDSSSSSSSTGGGSWTEDFAQPGEKASSSLQHSSSDSANADGSYVDHAAADSAMSDSAPSTVLKDLQALRQRRQQQSIPPHTFLLDDVEAAATAGPVGGAKAAYVAAKLLAAAVWRQWGLEEDPLQGLGCVRKQLSHLNLPEAGQPRQLQRSQSAQAWQQQQQQQGEPGGGQCLPQVLLSSGGFLPAHHAVIHSLGGCADVLTPVLADGHGVRAAAGDVTTPGGQVSEGRGHSVTVSDQCECDAALREKRIIGWCPNLYHDVFQDIDLV
jgi:hypothetical protein